MHVVVDANIVIVKVIVFGGNVPLAGGYSSVSY